MQRIRTYGFGDVLPSADLDTWQDNTLGIAQLPGAMVGPAYVYSSNGTDIQIGMIRAMMLGNPNSSLFTTGESTFTPTGLSNNTCYLIYAINSTGTITFEKSGVVPDGAQVYQSLDTTRRYITSFAVNGGGQIIPFRHQGGLYLYDTGSSTAASDLNVKNSGVSTTLSIFSLAKLVPDHIRSVLVSATFVRGGSDTAVLQKPLDAGNYFFTFDGNVKTRVAPILTDDSQQLAYQIFGGGGSALSVDVLGYHG